MPLPQDISPINSEMLDTIARTGSMDWIETVPGKAYLKILWISPDSGRWAVMLRWMKGYTAQPHKHLSGAHAYILSGRLQVRDGTLEAGDFIYEPNGMVHGETTALEDTEYLFMCDGPVLFFDDNSFTGYRGWEQLQRIQDQQQVKAAAE